MEIRPAAESDIRAIAELWATAFPGRRTVDDRVRMLETGGRYGGLETVLVTEVDGRIAGAAKLYSMTQHITGLPVPMMGLAAVAVAPDHRRQGIAARLCQEAVETAAARGDAISVLYPFRPDYYQRLGWGLTGHLVEHRFATVALVDLAGDPAVSQVRPARLPADGPAIAAVYAEVAGRSHGPIARDERVWAYRISGQELGVLPVDPERAWTGGGDPRRAVLVHQVVDGAIDGYALLRYRPSDDPAGRKVVIRELISRSPEAYRGLLGWVARKAEQWPRALHYARPGERFADRLRDPRPPGSPGARSLYFPAGRIIRGPMLRILDVERALQTRRWFDGPRRTTPDPPIDLQVRVRDELRPANSGMWFVTIAGEGSGVAARAGPAEVAARRGSEALPSIDTDIATFSRVWAGELLPSEAAELGLGRLSGDKDLLDAAFSTRHRPWLLDEF